MATRVEEKVRQFIGSNFYVADALALGDDSSLLETGVVDSTGVLEIITFLEGEFGIEVADDEVLPQNLDSISGLTAFVGRKLAARGAGGSQGMRVPA